MKCLTGKALDAFAAVIDANVLYLPEGGGAIVSLVADPQRYWVWEWVTSLGAYCILPSGLAS